MEDKLILAIVAGLFSLLGGFVGSFLARRTQYEKWLLENRSEVFSQFLELMYKAREQTTNVLYDETKGQAHNDIRITEIYTLPLNYAKTVRLYLPKNQREKFQKLAVEVWALHSDKELGFSRLSTMNGKLDEIQAILESNL